MYIPTAFAATDEQVRELLASPGLVDLVSSTEDGLVATPLPMLLDGSSLLGHVARNNPHWRLARGESVAIVRGPEAYVSPSWYATKREHGRVVPTWNYVVGHAYGELVVHDDVEWLRDLVTRLTGRHESGRDEPWAVADAPPAFVDGQLRAIVGVELRITRVEAKAKLSQNRPPADVDGVIAGLDGDPIAEAMWAAQAG
jgi:transcriptional regulator